MSRLRRPGAALAHALSLLLATSSLGAEEAAEVLTLTRRVRGAGGPSRRLRAEEAWLYGDLHDLLAYHVDVLVGTPGQMQSVIVDTGSSLTAFPCASCGEHCGEHLDEPFDPNQSSSFWWVSCADVRCSSCKEDRCHYSVRYLEGSSITGNMFQDMLHLGHRTRGNRAHSVWMGCHSLETRLFKTQVPSGIMGLYGTGWDVIEASTGGELDRELFSLCLGEQGGVMTLSAVNETWTPLLSPLSWLSYSGRYNVFVAGVRLEQGSESEEVLLPLANFAVDSGTTFTYFTGSQYTKLRTAIDDACAEGRCGGAVKSSGTCWTATAEAVDLFPALRFGMGQDGAVAYLWLARGYLYRRREGLWCYSFAGSPPLTLGASFMQNHLVVFDRDNKQIGVAAAKCPLIGNRQQNRDVSSEGLSEDATTTSRRPAWASRSRPRHATAALPLLLVVSMAWSCGRASCLCS